MDTPTPHSAAFFGDFRDFWWNRDFLELMARRWNLSAVQSVLDVGCGIGHWGRILLPLLPEHAKLTGIDREPEWIEKANTLGDRERTSYLEGDVMALPFEDSSFDLVTCQTVLIHLQDPLGAIREMMRVAKPGGLIVTAEPNN